MQKAIFLASAILLSISNIASAGQTIHFDKKNGDSPILKWYSESEHDVVQLNPGGNDVYLLITNDRITNNHRGCHVEISGCQAGLIGLSPGDAALCEPKEAAGGVQMFSTCTYEEDGYTDASGTYQFLIRK